MFYSHFRNYITEANAGLFADDEGNIVPPGADDALSQEIYRGVPADFYGFEAESSFRVLDRGAHKLDLLLSGDYTNARNSDTGEPLPRIPPLRAGLRPGVHPRPLGSRRLRHEGVRAAPASRQ